jgi:hypothetical protein
MNNAGLEKVPSSWLAASAAIVGLVCAIGLTPVPAAAQGTPEQQQACTPDVMRLCNQFIPDVPKITACMSRNRANISPACRAAFAHPSHGGRRISHRASHHHVTHHPST